MRTRTAIAVVALLAVQVATAADTIGDKQQQLQGINGQITGTKTELKVLLDKQRQIERQVAALDAQLAQVAEQMQEETARLELLGLQVQVARQDLADKEAALAQHIRDFGSRLRALYKSGRVSGLELVFSAGNFTDLLNRVFFFDDILREDDRVVTGLRQERAVIGAVKKSLEAKQMQQAQVVATIQSQAAALRRARDQRAADEAQLAALAALVQRQLDAMQAQRAALQAQIARLLAESLRARSSGRWKWPIDGFISQGFGCTTYPFEPWDPACPSRHFHSGVDIANDWGTPVHAADGGIVHNFETSCWWGAGGLCGYGRYVLIVHAGGFTSLYGHLSGWAAPEGAQVSQDTVIGYEGSTGASTGPHLHFEIDLGGTPVDPLAYLP